MLCTVFMFNEVQCFHSLLGWEDRAHENVVRLGLNNGPVWNMSVEEITFKVKFQNNFAIILFTAVHLSQLKIRISIRKSKTWRKFRIKNNSSIPFLSLSRRNFVEGGKGGCSHYLNFATLEVLSYNARSKEYKYKL